MTEITDEMVQAAMDAHDEASKLRPFLFRRAMRAALTAALQARPAIAYDESGGAVAAVRTKK